MCVILTITLYAGYILLILPHGLVFMCLCIMVEIMQSMGYTRDQVEESLSMHRCDDVSATYRLLGLKPGTVRYMLY